MNHEFSGNVFCIYGKHWDTDPLTGDRMMPIESAFQVALTQRAPELAIWSATPPVSAEGSEAWAEQSFANIYADYVAFKTRVSESADDPVIKSQLEQVDSASERAYANRTLPDEIYSNNMYVHPNRLGDLATILRSASSINSLLPLSPFAIGAYDNLKRIFEVIDQVFIKSNTRRHEYFAFLALRWMRGDSLHDLVRARLDYRRVPDDEKRINEEIRDLFCEIEEELRYLYVKYTTIYLQVLAHILAERGDSERAERLLPVHMFLEFGASDKTLINLMSLGLSRTSAILLKRVVTLGTEMSIQECQRYLDAINLDRISIPAICRTEIARLRGKRA